MAKQVHYERAAAFLRAHYCNHVAVTKEGILATSWCRRATDEGCEGDDWYEEAMLFPIAEDNTVCAGAIRDWLGY